jgi:hypothetical protein
LEALQPPVGLLAPSFSLCTGCPGELGDGGKGSMQPDPGRMGERDRQAQNMAVNVCQGDNLGGGLRPMVVTVL